MENLYEHMPHADGSKGREVVSDNHTRKINEYSSQLRKQRVKKRRPASCINRGQRNTATPVPNKPYGFCGRLALCLLAFLLGYFAQQDGLLSMLLSHCSSTVAFLDGRFVTYLFSTANSGVHSQSMFYYFKSVSLSAVCLSLSGAGKSY